MNTILYTTFLLQNMTEILLGAKISLDAGSMR